MNKIKTEDLKYQRLSQEEQKKRGILGRLVGVCADFINPTRNGRKYSESLWENVFNSDIMKEKIANKVCFGELGHPADREEVDMDKVAICLAEQPTKNDKGQLMAVFDILNTPNGKILKTLCDYGSNIGISSRGSGDLYTDDNGDEAVDPDTYNCECFDVVLIPAVKEARLKYVTESLDTKKYGKTLKQKLTEDLGNASEEDKKVMKESLSDLGINLLEEVDDTLKDRLIDDPEVGRYIVLARDKKTNKLLDSFGVFGLEDLAKEKLEEVKSENPLENAVYSYEKVDPDGTYNNDPIYEELNEKAPKTISNKGLLDKLISSLKDKYGEEGWQDQLFKLLTKVGGDAITAMADEEHLRENESVEEDCSDIEDSENKEEAVNDGEDLMKELQETLVKTSNLEKDNLSLQEKLSVCSAKEIKLEEQLKRYKEALVKVSDQAKETKSLKEKLTQKEKLIESRNQKIEKLIQSARDNSLNLRQSNSTIDSMEEEISKLKESLNDSNTKLEESNQKLEESNKQLNESKIRLGKYQRALKEAKENYIQVKAEAYGLKKEEIVSKLNESFTLQNVDSICEELVEYKKAINKLPFRITENTHINVKPSDNEYIKGNRKGFIDDDSISDSLLRMADLK